MLYLVDIFEKDINTSSFLYISCTFLNPFSACVGNPASLLPDLKLALPQIGQKRVQDRLMFRYLQVSDQMSIIFNTRLSVFFLRLFWSVEYKNKWSGKLGLTEQDFKSVQAGVFSEEK